jgi:hypothetical protein
MVTLPKEDLLALITPATDVLWSIHCGVQCHECRYRAKTEIAIDGLTKLIQMSISAGNGE